MGLNATLHTAGRSLDLYSAGVQVAGQNVANASTPNYVREDLLLSTASPYESGGLIFGTGAQSDGVRQSLDYFLEGQIHTANADAESALSRQEGFTQLQLILAELGDQDLSTQLNQFTAAINEVINQPELTANRQTVLQQGKDLAGTIQTMRARIDRVRESNSAGVETLVKEANSLIDQVSKLNTKILRLEASGLLKSDAGGLRTERLVALNRLSEIIPIRTVAHGNGSIDVFSGNDYLVIGNTTQQLETYREVDQGIAVDRIRFSKTQVELNGGSGQLGGLVESRDQILGGFAGQLDQYAQTIIQQVNEIHSSGEGTEGFQTVTGTNGIEDTTAALNEAGLTFAPRHGSFEVKVFDQSTGTTSTTRLDIDLDGLGGNDTTLGDLQTALDAIGNLNASVDQLGKLTLTAADGYEIRFANDNSGTLAALGINTFFSGNDANSIQVNNVLQENPNLFAAGLGGGPGDNRNAVRLATFMEQPVEGLGGQTLDGFYGRIVSQTAESAAAETSLGAGFRSFRDSLFGQRQQHSGVSLDEEAIKIIQYQQGYAAAARIISTVDELFSTLLSI